MSYRTLLFAAYILMFCGCVQEDAEKPTTSTIRTTTTPPQTTSSTRTAETTTATSKTNTSAATSSSTTTTTMVWDTGCAAYCIEAGYLSGGCQVNLLECQRRLMEAAEYRGALCADRRFDYCCCKTNESIDRDTCFTLDTIENKYLQ